MPLFALCCLFALFVLLSPAGQAQDAKDQPAKPGSVKIIAKVDGYTQGTEFNTQKYPFKYTGASQLDPDQMRSLTKAGDVPDAAAKALVSAVLWPGKDDKLEKVKLKSDGRKISGEVELTHKYGKQGVHILKFKLEGTVQESRLRLRALDPIVVGTWDWGGGKIRLEGKVDILFETGQ